MKFFVKGVHKMKINEILFRTGNVVYLHFDVVSECECISQCNGLRVAWICMRNKNDLCIRDLLLPKVCKVHKIAPGEKCFIHFAPDNKNKTLAK